MSTEEDREALARLVDPKAWREPILPETYRAVSRDESLMKADAILAAGFHRTPAPAPDVQALIEEAREHLAVAADAAPRSVRAAILAGDVEDQRMSLVARLADALEAVAHSDYHDMTLEEFEDLVIDLEYAAVAYVEHRVPETRKFVQDSRKKVLDAYAERVVPLSINWEDQ